jgi:hypothetical protein
MKKISHHLITLDLGAGQFHCYLMTSNKRDLILATNKLMVLVDKHFTNYLPFILATDLGSEIDDAVKLVRKVVSADSEKAAKCLATATDFHITIFMLRSDHPDAKALMELH